MRPFSKKNNLLKIGLLRCLNIVQFNLGLHFFIVILLLILKSA